jgi:very-short-patch-repair endonuclease
MKGVDSARVFMQILKDERLPLPVREYRFYPERRWRADYCWIDHLLILETEGAVWTHGRHTRGSGFVKDIEKYNMMTLLGYRLIRVPTHELCNRSTIDLIKKLVSND